MKLYKTKEFMRFARKAGLSDARLAPAASAVAAGAFDADYGGGVYKQRVARDNAGKSGGYRTIVLFRAGGHSVFAAGFAKKDKANLSALEVKALKLLAKVVLAYGTAEIETALATGQFTEVESDGDEDKA